MLTKAQTAALNEVAKAFGWGQRPLKEMELIMWAAFHYYVTRLPRP